MFRFGRGGRKVIERVAKGGGGVGRERERLRRKLGR